MHIYMVSKLFKKPPSAWMGVIRSMDQGRAFMTHQYRPLKQAIIRELEEPGSGREFLEMTLETRESLPAKENVDLYNREAFRRFQDSIQPRILRMEENFLDPHYEPEPVMWEGVELDGQFHCSALNRGGKLRYCFFHASRWQVEETEAFIELLTIIAELRHGAEREAVWFVDLRHGDIIRPLAHYKKLRTDLHKMMELYARLEKVLHADYDYAM